MQEHDILRIINSLIANLNNLPILDMGELLTMVG